MSKQKLSPEAAAAKKERDLKAAKTPWRRYCKRTSQKKRRKAKNNNKNVSNMDYDHKDSKFKSSSANRSGTKGENTASKYGY